MLVALGIAMSGCGPAGPDSHTGAGEVQDVQFGLSRAPLASAPIGARYAYAGKDAGENARLPRAFTGAPPMIPHSTEGLLPITLESNTCVQCHGTPGPPRDDPPPAPPSHFVDRRGAPAVSRKEVAGARWLCTSCHLPQTHAPLLVGNGNAH